MRIELKWIEYRGGIARFRIPKVWKEEYAPQGGGSFFEDRPGSGTLWLEVLSVNAKGRGGAQELVENFERQGGIETLQDGLRLRRTKDQFEEEGTAGVTHRWEVAIPVPPDRLRIACFSYSVPLENQDDPTNRSEIALVDWSVRHAEFSREPGRIAP